MVRASRLRFFGHIARAQSTEDHRRAVWAAMQKLPLSREATPGKAKLDLATSDCGRRQTNELWCSHRLAESK